MGFHTETRPGTASKLYDISGFRWSDAAFRKKFCPKPRLFRSAEYL